MQTLLEYIKKKSSSNYGDDSILTSREKMEDYLKENGFTELNTDHRYKESTLCNYGQKCYITGKYTDPGTEWISISDGRWIILSVRTTDKYMYDEAPCQKQMRISVRRFSDKKDVSNDGFMKLLTKIVNNEKISMEEFFQTK